DAASLVYTKISLREIVASIIDLFEPLILQQEREVELRLDPDIIVWADETRLKQILRNLFANALRYSPEKSTIRITTNIERGKHMARVNVIDYGPGIPPDKQEAIFDKFVRLERDIDRKSTRLNSSHRTISYAV